MAEHSDTSWKNDHPSTLLSNSVQRADHAVKQAMSNPVETAIEQAYNSIEHTENALLHAEHQQENMDTVEQNKQQLERMKQQLREV
ncbi:MAG: hypothetical protein P0Y55_18135 [Candidatus Cohnella colombiensis]|uniref:DUF2564 family protein n=1 Tax=Candidatus Cohnella colombiensis TaxID=3121368 RepID=A0AA95JCZ0_9BACL|nr:MAG: hypothetical protein P0Y55_18135 [Cohnella sp.]